MLPMSTREGLRGARSAEAAVSPMGHFVAYMRGIQKAAGLPHRVYARSCIEHTHVHSEPGGISLFSIVAVQPGHAACMQRPANNDHQLQTAQGEIWYVNEHWLSILNNTAIKTQHIQ